MKKDIDYKVENGKLLRIEAEIKEGIINSIKITGDFFIYPETAIIIIEKEIEGKNICETTKILDELIHKEHINIIGFNSSDIEKALKRIEQ
jgi:lipoate---protein ligase